MDMSFSLRLTLVALGKTSASGYLFNIGKSDFRTAWISPGPILGKCTICIPVMVLKNTYFKNSLYLINLMFIKKIYFPYTLNVSVHNTHLKKYLLRYKNIFCKNKYHEFIHSYIWGITPHEILQPDLTLPCHKKGDII